MPTYEAHPSVMWELTRACDLHCSNCTIGATESPGMNELTTYEAYKTIDQIASLAPREFIITGGDPLEREDVIQIVNYARRRGLDPALVASPTSQLTAAAIDRLERNGLTRIIFSIDGSSPEVHHAVRGAAGTFAATLRAIRWAESAGLAVEINTLITRRNAGDLAAIVDLIRPIGITRWNLHFLVPLMASARPEMLTAGQTERLFATIDEIRGREKFAVRVVEAPHYRRFRLQRELDTRLDNATAGQWADFSGYEAGDGGTQRDLMDSAVDGARGFVFISHAGDVRASEFLLFSAGNLRYRPLDAIYRVSDLFIALRDPDNLKGKCGRCEFRHICGGSRARAWAVEGNVFADDPLCAYEPGLALPLPAAGLRQTEASS
jgi:radical SAM protein with 4Fe4S-binding SPASM domain